MRTKQSVISCGILLSGTWRFIVSADCGAAHFLLLRANCSTSEIDDADPSACGDPNDLHILGLALHVSADFVVTADKDILGLVLYGDTRIVTPREFWAAAKEHASLFSEAG